MEMDRVAANELGRTSSTTAGRWATSWASCRRRRRRCR